MQTRPLAGCRACLEEGSPCVLESLKPKLPNRSNNKGIKDNNKISSIIAIIRMNKKTNKKKNSSSTTEYHLYSHYNCNHCIPEVYPYPRIQVSLNEPHDWGKRGVVGHSPLDPVENSEFWDPTALTA